jgi:hypothetical protein
MQIDSSKIEQLIVVMKEHIAISEEVAKEDTNDEFLHGYAIGQKSAYEESLFNLELIIREATRVRKEAQS